jgi:cystathionine beta-lyase/cystathionine gamma-synthase
MEEEIVLNIHTKAVHSGDRLKAPAQIPVTTPIYAAASYISGSMEELDRVMGREEPGYSYGRYDNPTNAAFEEQVRALENGYGALACSSGMAAVQMALTTALADRRRSILASDALYGATIGMLNNVFDPMGVSITWVDTCDLDAVSAAIEKTKPGCIVLETISNPLLRVPQIDRISELARAAGAAVVVDNTFATPLIVRPLELGANFSVHSATKYFSGHGDVLGGVVISDEAHYTALRTFARIIGPGLGPFECYLAMRGVKTFPLRMERQCSNACRVAAFLAAHPKVERVYFPADPKHPDAETIARLFPSGVYGAMVSFEIRGAAKPEIFQFMDKMKLVVRATSLGDVHSIMLYPVMSSHRDVSPKHRERAGIRDNLVRLSVGIEGVEDIIADLEQALA